MPQLDEQKIVPVTNDRYRQHFHIMTNGGWLNDPNGLCFYKGYYHVFYQYHPYSTEWGPMHWGHVRSKDLLHWEYLPVALIPGDPEDDGGCFSGSAIVKDGRLYLIYTGQHYYDDGDQDHFWENQNVAFSDDGIHFQKYSGNPVIEAPKDNTQHFRDPKVWQHGDHYYLVLGSQNTAGFGRLLLYQSTDLLHWQEAGIIDQAHDLATEGFMWECPDLFSLGEQDVMVTSPMGIKATTHENLNSSQVDYSIGHLDYGTPHFSGTKLTELDHGHNFYATQTMLTPDQRRIQIGWMSPFEEQLQEHTDGWAGCLTFPRELTIQNNRLIQQPIWELVNLRQSQDVNETTLVNAETPLTLSDPQHCEIDLHWPEELLEEFSWQLNDQLGKLLALTYADGQLTLYRRGADAYRYASAAQLRSLQILVDTSSVEVFVNDGESTFTERYYATGPVAHFLNGTGCTTEVVAYRLA